jgi:hypothetical protein
MELFGFQVGKKEDASPKTVESFVAPDDNDGALNVADGGFYGTSIDQDGTSETKNEIALISKYRQISQQPEAERAIDDIVNEAIIADKFDMPVSISVDDVELPEQIREIIREEFDNILRLLKFETRAHEIFRNWYIDGRIFYHIMIDTANPRNGIQDIRFIDPRKIKKVRSEKDKPNPQNNIFQPKEYDDYYIYSENGVVAGNQGIKVAPDAIAYCHSGIQDENNKIIVSHLHKSIKPLNQLRMLEDATVIYRLARAPERRVFYIDVGNLPKAKAEQYLRDMMAKHKNKLVYDASTGAVRDDRKFMTMLEDFWLPRREGGRSTEITTLPPGQNLGELDDVLYFRKKLYESLNVPVGRLESEGQFNMGRASEISRDEVKFARFISRLRSKFSELLSTFLERQLLLKGVITKQEWKEVSSDIKFDYLEDNHFSELKAGEIMRERIGLLQEIDEYVGKYYSQEFIRKNILMQTEEEIEEINLQIEAEDESGDEDFEEE